MNVPFIAYVHRTSFLSSEREGEEGRTKKKVGKWLKLQWSTWRSRKWLDKKKIEALLPHHLFHMHSQIPLSCSVYFYHSALCQFEYHQSREKDFFPNNERAREKPSKLLAPSSMWNSFRMQLIMSTPIVN